MDLQSFDLLTFLGLADRIVPILHYRKEQRLTQEQLANACGENGVSRNYIQRIETGVSSCSLDTLMDIAKALDVPLYKLFEFKE